jgi:hypothetical protein
MKHELLNENIDLSEVGQIAYEWEKYNYNRISMQEIV